MQDAEFCDETYKWVKYDFKGALSNILAMLIFISSQ